MNLHDALLKSQALGFLGPGDVSEHIRHADRWVQSLPESAQSVIDLGSGGGVPGLVLAERFPDRKWILVDAIGKRCAFLRSAVSGLGLENASVIEGRAEELARTSNLRHSVDVVVARSFGKPAVVSECATGFLKGGGWLIVSEPPESVQRWDDVGLARLGMHLVSRSEVAVVFQDQACSEDWPRRNGIPAKRPLF